VNRLWGSGNALLDDDEGLGNGISGHGTVAFLVNTVQFLTVVRYRLRCRYLDWMTQQQGETRLGHYNGSGRVEPGRAQQFAVCHLRCVVDTICIAGLVSLFRDRIAILLPQAGSDSDSWSLTATTHVRCHVQPLRRAAVLFRHLRSGQGRSEGLVRILWLAPLERQDVRLQDHTFVDHNSPPNRLLLAPGFATGQQGWQVSQQRC
jgi:hypothetical protein